MADPTIEPELLAAAIAVQAHAHVPYSHFRVGAVIRTRSGAVFAGCNVENAAYPEGTCAEAGAIAAMVLGGEHEILDIVTVTNGAEPGSPCGGCRQKIREFAGPDTVIHSFTTAGPSHRWTMAELLPGSFGPEFLST